MQRLWRALLLAALIALALSVGVLADDTVSGPGFYMPSRDTRVTFYQAGQAVTAVSANVNGGTDYESFYPGADRLTLTLTGTSSDAQYAVFLVTGEGLPTSADTLCYIDQKGGGELVFDVYPLLPTVAANAAQPMTLYVTSNAAEFQQISIPLGYAGSGSYTVQPYVLGDVDNDGDINAKDALEILKYTVDIVDLDSTQLIAADVNRNSEVNGLDALDILKYTVDLITSF